MGQIRRVTGTSVYLGRAAVRSVPPTVRHRRAFADLQAYVMFVGYPRSGHTLVGSLLDAHPQVVIAHELDALRLVRWGVPRRTLFGLLLRQSEEFAASGSRWMGYDYRVPGWWQGRYETLRVIGDKRGATSSSRIGARPELLARLRATVGLPLRFVRVVRNPFDNVARMYLVARERGRTLDEVISNYCILIEGSEAAAGLAGPDDWLDVRTESVVADPRRELAQLCSFVGVEPVEGYLDAVAAVVFPTPNRTRERIDWPTSTVDRLDEIIAATPHLHGYAIAD